MTPLQVKHILFRPEPGDTSENPADLLAFLRGVHGQQQPSAGSDYEQIFRQSFKARGLPEADIDVRWQQYLKDNPHRARARA